MEDMESKIIRVNKVNDNKIYFIEAETMEEELSAGKMTEGLIEE